MSPEFTGAPSSRAPVARVAGALVRLDTTPVVPAPGSHFGYPLDLLTRETLTGPPHGPSESESLSPSRLLVNPKVAGVNGESCVRARILTNL